MRLLNRILLLCAFLVTGACAGLEPKTPEEIVGERALEQARALMAADFDTAIEYMTPSYKNSDRASDFKRSRSGATGWMDASLKWVKCDDEPQPTRCEVRLLVKIMRPPAVTTPIIVPLDDVWILVDGEWYQYR